MTVPMWWGGARARVRVGKLPGSDVPLYCLEYNRYFDRPYLYGPPAEGYADNLERFTFLSRGSLELCKALGFFPDVIHCNDWQTALVPVYVNTVEWVQPLHAAATIYSIHNLAYQGVFDGGGMFITGLGREHYNPRRARALRRDEPDQGRRSTTARCCRRSARPTRARSRRGAYGCGLDGVLSQRNGDLRRHPERHRHRRVEPGDRPPPAGALRRRRPQPARRRARRRCRRRRAVAQRPDVPVFGIVGRLTPAEGLRRAGARARPDPGLGRADRAARHRRHRRRALLRVGRRARAAIGSAPGCASTTAAPTASRRAPTSS